MTRRRKVSRRVIPSLLTVLILGMLLQVPVMASSIWDDVIWDNRESKDIDGDYAEDIQYSRTKGNHLDHGQSTITKGGSNKVLLSGSTIAHHTCDTLYLYLYLEQKVDGSYSTYKYWRYTKDNTYDLTKGLTVLVPSGYYYRLRGYHAAVQDGNKEPCTTLTDGILID